jgi:hypothetical protein
VLCCNPCNIYNLGGETVQHPKPLATRYLGLVCLSDSNRVFCIFRKTCPILIGSLDR